MNILDLLQFGTPLNGVPSAPEGQPGIYASQEEWAAYRAKQASDKTAAESAVTASAAGSDIRQAAKFGDMNAASAESEAIQALLTSGAGAGRGVVNPDAVTFNGDQILDVLKAGNSQSTVYTGDKRVDDMNKNAEGTGIKTTRDANGGIVISNVGGDNPMAIRGPRNASAPLPGTPNAPVGVSAILGQLQTTTDVDTARGLGASLREAIAREQVSVQTSVLRLAQNKVGVPVLEEQLAQAEAADRQDPMWVPGIGDSPITAKIRASLGAARGQADSEANRLMETNTTMASLKASAKTAELELARITKLGDRKDLAAERQADTQENIRLNKELSLQAKLDQKKMKDEERASGLTPTQRSRIVQLAGPQINADDASSLINVVKMREKDKEFIAAVDATDEALPRMAIGGNQYATNIVVAREQENTGRDQNVTVAMINKVRELANDPTIAAKAFKLRAKGAGSAGDEQAKKDIAAFNQKSNGGPEDKASAREMRYQMALEVFRAQRSVGFITDLGTWNTIDPELLTAQDQAFKLTGKKQLDDVLAAYTGAATGPDYLAKVGRFEVLMKESAKKQENSMFGAIDYRAVQKSIVEAAQASDGLRGWVREKMRAAGKVDIQELTRNPLTATLPFVLPMTLANAPANVANAMKPTTPINPATGKPFGE